MLLPVQDCGRGTNKDLLPSELAPGVWSDSSNVRPRNGFARRRSGYLAAYNTPSATPYCLATFSAPTTRYLMELGTAAVYADDGSTLTDITGTPPTGARDDRWSAFDFNGVFVCNNGVDDPMYWNGNTATNLATIPGWTAGTKCDAMRPFRDYIMAIAPTISGTKYPYRVMWGNAAEPGALPSSWTAAATNDAGDKDLVGAGYLIDGLALGSSFILYGERGRYMIRYVGGDAVFSFDLLQGSDGLLTRGCVVDTPRGHVFLTNGDVRLHNGGESVSIADGIVREHLRNTIDETNGARSFVCLNPQENEVWVCFPASGSSDCDTVLAWNWTSQPGEGWSIHSAPNLTYGVAGLVSEAALGSTWALDTENWDQDGTVWSQQDASANQSRLIVATSGPVIGLAGTGGLDLGTSIDWHAEKTGIPLSDTRDLVRSISRVRLSLDATAGTQVLVKVATTMNPDDTPTYSTSATYTQGTTNWVNVFTNAGRYASIRIEGLDDQAFAMRSYQIEITDNGARW